MEKATIKRGESFYRGARPNTLTSGDPIGAGWECKAGLYNADFTEVIASFDVSDKATVSGEEYFIPGLTRSQTKDVAPGLYIFAIDIFNESVSPEFSQESHIQLEITGQAIPTST